MHTRPQLIILMEPWTHVRFRRMSAPYTSAHAAAGQSGLCRQAK